MVNTKLATSVLEKKVQVLTERDKQGVETVEATATFPPHSFEEGPTVHVEDLRT